MFQERLLYLLDVKCNGKKIELSKATGIASSVITSYFTRGSAPSAIQLVKIADFFKCSVDYLLGREDDFGFIQTPGDNYTSSEKIIIKIYRTLSERDKKIVDNMFLNLASPADKQKLKELPDFAG